MELNGSSILQIDHSPDNQLPYYVRICDAFFKMVDSKMIVAGQQLPGENILASFWNVSRGTVREAMRKLEEDGFIYKTKGKGTVVSERAFNGRHGLQWCNNPCTEDCVETIDRIDIRITYEPCGEFLANVLGCERGGFVVAVADCDYFADSEQVSASVAMLPAKLLEDYCVDLNDEAEMKRFILERLYDYAAASEAFINTFDAEESDDQRLKNCSSILFIEEVLRDSKDTPLAFVKYYLKGNFYRIPLDRRSKPISTI